MPAELHIESDKKKLTLKKWLAAVAKAEDVRCLTENVSVTSPQTGAVLSIPRETGDAEVYFPESDEWVPVFYWRRSSVALNARPYTDSQHLRRVTAGLVKSLGAKIVDDEGNPAQDV